MLGRYKEAGGHIAVISHSERHSIQDHYLQAGAEDLPDAIFGWEQEAERRKPSPWPVTRALADFGIPPREAIVADDLKPGVLMARAASVPFASAGWGHRIGAIESYMRADPGAYRAAAFRASGSCTTVPSSATGASRQQSLAGQGASWAIHRGSEGR